jgi:hypothetical protein
VRAVVSFHVALQDDGQFPEAALAFRGIGCPGDAAFGVLLDENLRERLEGFSRGNDLGENLGAIDVAVDHAFDGLNLTCHFVQANLQRLSLGRIMMMMMMVIMRGRSIGMVVGHHRCKRRPGTSTILIYL